MSLKQPVIKKDGFSLVEILVAIGFFAIVVSGIALLSMEVMRTSNSLNERILAKMYSQEIFNALKLNKTTQWSTIVENTDGATKHLTFTNNKYEIVDGVNIVEDISVSFTINNVQRDASGNIVQSGGTMDLHTRVIDFTATWTDIFNNPQTINYSFYINDWDSPHWVQTTMAEFNAGMAELTAVTNNNGGEVELTGVLYADWCKPSITLSSYDIPGQGVASALTAITGNAFVGTGENASGLSFANVLIGETDPPTVTVDGTFNGYKTNGIFGDGGYAYLTTDDNAQEVVILQLASKPYTVVGSFDSSGSTNGESVFVSGNYGYMTAGNNFRIFDLSSKTGARTEVGTAVTLAGIGKSIRVIGNYAYVATNSTTTQLQIIDITNKSAATIVGQALVTGAAGVDVVVSSTGNRAYLVTQNDAVKGEYFIVDTSTKTGNRPTIGSFNTVAMNPRGVITVEDADRSIIVGIGGEEYQILDISTEATPTKCGALNFDAGVNDVATVRDTSNNAFSYIVTGDSSQELKIIKGGPGGGNAEGQGYAVNGTFISSVFDSGSTSTQYVSIDWEAVVPASTSLKLQVRTGTTTDLSSATWVGPDGTSATYFTSSNGTYLPTSISGNRYIQYKAIFASDTISTPVLEETDILYQP